MFLPLNFWKKFAKLKRFIKHLRNLIHMWRNKSFDYFKNKPVVIVLSLGSQGSSDEVARQAFLKNFHVHIFSPEFPVLEASFSHSWTKVDTLKDFDKALSIARNLKPVAILVELKNILLPMQCYLADALELRSIGELAAKTSNSKIALRQSLDIEQIKSVPWIKLEDFKSQSDFTFPGVIKPDLGTSSKGVRFVNCKEDIFNNKINKLSDIVNDISVGENFLLEGYVKGKQFDFEGVAVDGSYKLLCIVQEHYESLPPYFLPSCFYFNPPISENDYNLMWSNTKSALKALGVRNGAWHLEQRKDVNGTPRIIDYANRMGYNRLISQAAGVSFSGTYVDIMTNTDKEVETLKPKPILKILALDKETIERMKIFVSDYPQYVLSKSFRSFEFSYHEYFGFVVLTFDNLDLQSQLLNKYKLVPKGMVI